MKLAEILTGPEKWFCGGTTSTGWTKKPRDMTCLFDALDQLAKIEELDVVRERRRMFSLLGLDDIGFVGTGIKWNDQASWEDVSAAIDAYDRDRMLDP